MTVLREELTNGSTGTLGTTVGSSDSTMPVLTMTPTAPSTGQMHVKISSEIILITDLSASPWPISRGQETTTAASHASGSAVTQVFTEATANNLVAIYVNNVLQQISRDFNFPTGTLVSKSGQVVTITPNADQWRWEPVCDVTGSVLVDVNGNPVMAKAPTN